MKKLSIVLLAVLLVASLIISCDNSTKALTDELVEVQLGTQAGSRSLSSSVTLEQISDSSLKWFYSATKETQQEFATGQTTRAFIRLGDTKTFSQGKWTFVLWAEKDAVVDATGNTTTAGTKVYEGKIEHVLITKSSSPVPVVISVSPYVEGANGTVEFSGVMIQKYSGDSSIIETTAANVITLDGVNVELVNGNAIVNDVTPGPHTVSVSYVANIDGQEVVYASESILITVYSGRTTLIRGNVAEEVGSAEITVIATSAKVTTSGIVVNEGQSAETTIEAAVAPSNATAPKDDANKKTTVSFPEGALVKKDSTESGSVSATLSVDTKSIENNIQIENGSTAVAGINISLTVNGSPVTEFNDKYVIITTYIAKNLNDVKVVYNGTGAQPIATDVVGAPDPAIAASLDSDEGSNLGYNKNTGLLRFKTNHFSEFNVVADAVCYVSETNTAYSTLNAAFEAATGSRKTVVLLKDITGQVTVPSGADVILDLNGKSISTTNAPTIINNGTLVLKDTIGEGSVESEAHSAVCVGHNSTTTIESGNYSGREGSVITGLATGATININGGNFTASDNAVIAGNGTRRDGDANTINITGGTFNGGIFTTGYVACGIYAPWKDIINVSGGEFNITGGAGIVARAGNVNVSGGTFNCTGNATGKVGDSRVVVPCAVFVFDSSANYPALKDDSKIKVTGGTFISEDAAIKTVPETDVGRIVIQGGSFKDLASVIKYASEGAVIELEDDVTVTLDNGIANEGANSRNITIIGNDTQTVDVVTKAVSAEGGMLNYQRGSSFRFENLTIQAGEGSYDGIVCNELTFKNCTIKGKLALYGKATFINCTFDNTMANQYSIWTWGGTDVTFQDCTFNTNGKAILLYAEENTTKLTVNNCTFNDRNKGAADKAAIEIGDAHYGKHNNFTVVINRSSVETGFANGLNTTSKLWANKDRMDSEHLTVTIDGTQVH